jgi:hypothetical protein
MPWHNARVCHAAACREGVGGLLTTRRYGRSLQTIGQDLNLYLLAPICGRHSDLADRVRAATWG